MNAFKNQRPPQNNRVNRKQNTRNEKTHLPLEKILQVLSPSIEEYLEKSAENQKKIVAADNKIANSVSKLTEHFVSEKSNIKLNVYSNPIRKKSKKSNNTHHQTVKKIVLKMRENLKTYEEIARFLEQKNIPTFTKRGRWHAQTVHRLFQDYPES